MVETLKIIIITGIILNNVVIENESGYIRSVMSWLAFPIKI